MKLTQAQIAKMQFVSVCLMGGLAPLIAVLGSLGLMGRYPVVGIFLAVLTITCGVAAIWSLREQRSWMRLQMINLNEIITQAVSFTKGVEAKQNELLEIIAEDTKSVNEAMAQINELRVLIARARMDAKNSLRHTSLLSDMQAKQALGAVQEFNGAIAGMNRSQEELKSINDMMKLIAGKTAVVDDIVFKTSLLSFNANIEAARAGAYGRGFAVVAQEVSKLANHTGAASREISALIDESEKRVGGIVDFSLENTKVAESVAKQFADTFQGVLSALDTTVPLIKSVVTVTEEQESSCDAVVMAFNVLEKNAELKSKSSEAVREATAVLEFAFQDLQSIGKSMNVFSMTDEDKGGDAQSPPPSADGDEIKKVS